MRKNENKQGEITKKKQEELRKTKKKREETGIHIQKQEETRRNKKKLINLVCVKISVAYYVALDVQATQFGLRPNERSTLRCSGRPSNSIWLVFK